MNIELLYLYIGENNTPNELPRGKPRGIKCAQLVK